MKEISSGSIDLIVTSPPYDNLRSYNGSNDWSFDKFQLIASELSRLLVDGGVIVWVVNDATVNGSETGSSFRQALYFKDVLRMNIHDTMIYKKSRYVPLTHNRYEQAFEFMFVLTKGKLKTFNAIKIPCLHAGSFKGTGTFYKKPSQNEPVKVRGYTIKETKIRSNIWEYTPAKENKKTGHPAVFPLQLALDHVETWSNVGDTVLDPFMGSATTGIACQQTDRSFIGIEREENYFNIAKQRLGL